MQTIGFLGMGNMATALAEGFLRSKKLQAHQIYACARDWNKLCQKAKQIKFQPCHDAAELLENVDTVIVAVKPHQVAQVLAPLKGKLRTKIVLSVVNGYTYERYEEILLPATSHLYILPNTPVRVNEGVLLFEAKHSLMPAQYEAVKALFSALGVVQELPTNLMNIGSTLCGCGPAFISMLIEALADGAVMYGIPRDMAYRMASQMIVGTGKMQLETEMHPGALKDAVCSPGGTTIAGVAALERAGFRSAMIEAINAAQKRSL